MKCHRPHGFTLVELLVAITILALIAVFSWRGLDQVLRTRTAIEQSQTVLDGYGRVFARLERDLNRARGLRADAAGRLVFVLPAPAGAVPAPVAPAPPGAANPDADAGQARTIEVVYEVTNAQLVRRDPAGVGDEVLLDNAVMGWTGEVRRDDGSWGPSPENPAALPAGVRVRLELAGAGEVRRMFLVGE